jgi:hypothetical protein
MKNRTVLKTSLVALALCGGLALRSLLFAAEEPKMETLKGEVVDLMCYLDHGAKGEKHKGCAEKCIKGGGPVGLLTGEHLYLVVGDHAPMNDELAPKAGQIITLKGHVVERHGMRMIEKAQIVAD